MRICFIGSGIEREDTQIDGIEIESIARVVRSRFDSLVFGGSTAGLMYEFALAFKALDGHVVSIAPKWLAAHGLLHHADETILCDSLAERKQLMLADVDAVLCYPGGVGTWDELFDLLADRAVQPELRRPLVYVYSWEKYYAPLLLQMDVARELGLIHADVLEPVRVFETVDVLRKLIQDEY